MSAFQSWRYIGLGINTLVPREKYADHQERVELDPMKVSYADISAITASADDVVENSACLMRFISPTTECAYSGSSVKIIIFLTEESAKVLRALL